MPSVSRRRRFAASASFPTVACAAAGASCFAVGAFAAAPGGVAPPAELAASIDRAPAGYAGDQPGLDLVPPGGWLPPSSPADRMRFRFDPGGYGQYADLGDLENEAGDVSVLRGGFSAALELPSVGELDWQVRFGYEFSSYDFATGAAPLLGGTSDLVDDVHAWDLSLDATWRIDDRWSLFGGAGLLVAGESGADFSDMANVGGRLGVAYRVGDDLAIGLGAYARQDFDEGVEVLPLLLVDWRFADDWHLRFEGSQASVEWRASQDLRLALFAAFEIRAYALADDGIVANGAFNDERWVIGLAADGRLADGVWLRAAVGGVVNQEFDLENTDGDDVLSVESDDPGLFATLGISFEF